VEIDHIFMKHRVYTVSV